MSFYDTYGQGAQEKIAKTFNPEYLKRDIGYAKREIEEIQKFIRKAEDQLVVIAGTTFTDEVTIERRSYNKVEYYVSSAKIPRVPDGVHLKIYLADDSRKFGGKERKAVIAYALELSARYGNCPIVGSGAGLIKKKEEPMEKKTEIPDGVI
jgi:hypothetical protein